VDPRRPAAMPAGRRGGRGRGERAPTAAASASCDRGGRAGVGGVPLGVGQAAVVIDDAAA
jgi:hypothetical protein